MNIDTRSTEETTETTTTESDNMEEGEVEDLEQEQEQLSGTVRRREEPIAITLANKIFKDASGNRLTQTQNERKKELTHIVFKSGNRLHFAEENERQLILKIEDNPILSKVLSHIPFRLEKRMTYLSKFFKDTIVPDSTLDEFDDIPFEFYEDFREKFYKAYICEWRLRTAFQRLLVLWRIKKLDSTFEHTIDPVTLSLPEKPVYVYDWSVRKKFALDARSLANLIETRLLYQEYGFSVPSMPKNPRTNTEFTYKQLVSIYYQLKTYGELQWGLITLREYNFNKHRWQLYHKSALTMKAIKNSIILLDNTDARELLEDFIFSKMDDLDYNITNAITDIYKRAILVVPNHWYIQRFKSLAIIHYEAQHFNIERTSSINAACKNLLKKEAQFILELRQKNIIR